MKWIAKIKSLSLYLIYFGSVHGMALTEVTYLRDNSSLAGYEGEQPPDRIRIV